MAPNKSYGQGVFRSRASSVMPNANIVQHLNKWEVTGRALGITADQHHGFRLHFEWYGAFGNRCFQRRFPEYDSLSYFCTTLINGVPEDLCSCILVREGFYEYDGWVFGYVFDLLYSKKKFCGRVFPCITTRRDGSLVTLQEMQVWQEYGAGGHYCVCNISSSEALEGYY